MQEVVQRLPPRARHDGRQFDDGLVVLAGQEQPNQVLAHGFPFLGAAEEGVEVAAELVDRLGGRRNGFAGSRHGRTSLRRDPTRRARFPPPLLHVSCHS
jgi:hypothetical protein